MSPTTAAVIITTASTGSLLVGYFCSFYFSKNYLQKLEPYALFSLIPPVLLTIFGGPLGYYLIASLPAGFLIGLSLKMSTPHSPNKIFPEISRTTFILLLTGIIALAGINRYVNLGTYGFRLDEIYQYETAVGYLKTGQFVRWDFLKNIPGEKYLRSWPHTYLIAQSMKIFGKNLFAGRIVSLLFGLLIFVPLYFLSKQLNFHRLNIVFLFLWVCISPFCITISRWLRLYAPFTTLFLGFVVGFIYCLSVHCELQKSTIFYLTIICGVSSYYLHPLLFLLTLPAFIIAIIVKNLDTKQIINLSNNLIIKSIILFLVSGTLIYLSLDQLQTESGVFTTFYPIYLVYIVQENLGYALGGIALGVAIVLHTKNMKEKFLLFLIFIPLILLIFLTRRFPQVRYVGFILPVIALVILKSGRRLFRKISMNFSTLGLLIFLLTFVFIPLHSYFKTQEYIQAGNIGAATFPGFQPPNYRKTFKKLNKKVRSQNHLIVTCCNLSPLLAKFPNINFYSLGPNQKLKLQKLRKFEEKNKRNWVVIPAQGPHCLKQKTLKHVRNHYISRQKYNENFQVKVFKESLK